jgi:ATP-dependent Lhr-like helicase
VLEALWDLVFAGVVTGDTLAPLRARLAGGHTTHRPRPSAPRARMRPPSRLSLLRSGRPTTTALQTPAIAAGRWSLLPEAEQDATVRLHAAAEVLLDRFGIVTRGSVVAEGVQGGFAGVYRVFAALEESGRIRRGYFVESLGAAQFGGTGAVDRLRSFAPRPDELPVEPTAVVLAAADPASPYGAALPWPEPSLPETHRHRPARRAGALVALVDGVPAVYAERGGRTLLSFTEDGPALSAAAGAIAALVSAGRLSSLTVSKLDGQSAVSAAGPVTDALLAAGFTMTPRGLRLRSVAR